MNKACSAQIHKESFEGKLQAGEAFCFMGTVQGNFAVLCASSLAGSYIFLVLGLPSFCCYQAVVRSWVCEVNVSCRKLYTKALLFKNTLDVDVHVCGWGAAVGRVESQDCYVM